MKGKLFLIPSPLGDNTLEQVIPSFIPEKVKEIRHYALEELKTGRRYLSKLGYRGRIEELFLYELNEHTKGEVIKDLIDVLKRGENIGVISEAGLPAVADPGADLVMSAHSLEIEVIPLTGPSSIFMALMSSGLNGQCFCFSGYLPIKSDQRKLRIRELEKRSTLNNQTEIFIETPYRNDSLFQDLLSTCRDNTSLCIAADITLSSQYIKTKTIVEWKKSNFKIGKRPCVFLILG